jgi:chorismate-pyruvate lyase
MQTLPSTTPGEDAEWLDDLPAVQRLLLSTDGTMTTALAAYHGETIGVRLLGQDIVTLPEPDATLELFAGERVLARRALLVGKCSGTSFCYGRSRWSWIA